MYIIDGLRTPIGKRGRSLGDISAARLASIVIRALLKNNKLDGACVDEVILGNAVGAGQGQNPARQALIHAGLPSNVPAFTVNKVCGSGLKSVILASQAIACKDADVILAGGSENVSRCPHIVTDSETVKAPAGNDARPGAVKPGGTAGAGAKDTLINDGLWCSLVDAHMGSIAEDMAEKFGISREAQDDYALRSYNDAWAAQSGGLFRREIVPVETDKGPVVDADERPKQISREELSRMRPAFKPGGTVTAGNSPAPADGAAMLIIASDRALTRFGMAPVARILGYASAAVDPKMTFTSPALAVRRCLEASGLKMQDVDLFDINEAFAVQALMTVKELGLDTKRMNIFGGTIALGHPLGASGARGLVTLLNALKTEKKKVGVSCVCLGGGCAVAMAVRLLDRSER